MTDAPTSPPTEAPAGPAAEGPDRPVDLRLARLHLRTGSLALARVELETLAGSGSLDDEALLDLAEVRWRTDDLAGAGEAAAAHIAAGGEALVALVIAAEATAALGRPAEARRLAGRALELANGPLDDLFAGIPRSSVWPADEPERVAPLAPPPWATPGAAPGAGARLGAGHGPAYAGSIAVGAVAAGTVAGPGPVPPGPDRLPDPAAELEGARAALAAGDRAGAAIRLAVVLRLAPALAPAVLDVAAAEPGPAFDLVRGDAFRLVGHESQARRAYAAAARIGTDDSRPVADARREEGS